MAKKRKVNQNSLLLSGLAALLGVAAIIVFMCTQVVTISAGDGLITSTDGFKGYQVIFGYTASLDLGLVDLSGTILKFSFMNLLAIILVILGIVLSFTKGKILTLISIVSFVFGAILMIVPGSLLVLGDELKEAADLFKYSFPATTTAYVAVGLSGVSGIVNVVKLFLC